MVRRKKKYECNAGISLVKLLAWGNNSLDEKYVEAIISINMY